MAKIPQETKLIKRLIKRLKAKQVRASLLRDESSINSFRYINLARKADEQVLLHEEEYRKLQEMIRDLERIILNKDRT